MVVILILWNGWNEPPEGAGGEEFSAAGPRILN